MRRFLIIALILTACGGGAADTQPYAIVTETMTEAFPGESYVLVTNSVACDATSDTRLTVAALFDLRLDVETAVTQVSHYWASRTDVTERVVRSRWAESSLSDTIVTFTAALDANSADVLAYALECSADSVKKEEKLITP